MNLHELPMILFTVLSQMSVGAFVALGVLQLFAGGKYSGKVLDRLANPALLAIGPTLVLGLIASMFHMNDVLNVFNVFRNIGTSWLSREIVFGIGFAGLGFLYFVAQWRGWGSPRLRQVLALLTAVVGLGLVWCQAMIYYTLPTVPGWSHWSTPVRFFGTVLMLGSLAVTVAMAASLAKNRGKTATGTAHRLAAADTEGDIQHVGGGAVGSSLATMTRQTTLTDTEAAQAETLVRKALRITAMVTAVTAIVMFIVIPMYLTYLAQHPSTASTYAADQYTGAFFVARLVLLAIGAVLLALVAYRASALPSVTAGTLTMIAFAALAITFVSELMGRSMFYESLFRIGM